MTRVIKVAFLLLFVNFSCQAGLINYHSLRKPREWEGQIVLPDQMKQFKNLEIIHLKSLYQEEGACAWHSVLNAVSISELRQKGAICTSKSIKSYIEQTLIPKIRNQEEYLKQQLSVEQLWNGIRCVEQDKLTQFLHLSHYSLLLQSESQWCILYTRNLSNALSPYCDSFTYRDTYAIKSPPHFLKKTIFTIFNDPVHFLLSVPAEFGGQDHHAVLVSVIRESLSEKLTVIYMDSNNMPLDDNRNFWVLPSAIYRFFRALDESVTIKTPC